MGHAGEEEQGEGRQTQVLLWLGRAVGRKPDSKTTLGPPPLKKPAAGTHQIHPVCQPLWLHPFLTHGQVPWEPILGSSSARAHKVTVGQVSIWWPPHPGCASKNGQLGLLPH